MQKNSSLDVTGSFELVMLDKGKVRSRSLGVVKGIEKGVVKGIEVTY